MTTITYYKLYKGDGSSGIAFKTSEEWKELIKSLDRREREHVTVTKISIEPTLSNIVASLNDLAGQWDYCRRWETIEYEDIDEEVNKYIESLDFEDSLQHEDPREEI